MTDDDLERRLRALLDTQAGRVDPQLSGPRLRHRATRSVRRSVRRFAPALATAAAVVVLAGAVALIARDDSRPAPAPVQPGGGTVSTVPAGPTSRTAPLPTAPPITPTPSRPTPGSTTPSPTAATPTLLPSTAPPATSSPVKISTSPSPTSTPSKTGR